MTPGTYNFPKQKRGDTFAGHSFEVFDDGVPVNFVGADIKLQVRKNSNQPIVLEWKTSDASIIISGASNNIISMAAKTGTVMDIEGFPYLYDVQALLSTGVTNTYLEGTFEIVNDITR